MAVKKITKANIFDHMKKGINFHGYKPPVELCKLTVQDSIPIYAVHEAFNLIETYPGLYTRSYKMDETNYQTETEAAQQQMFITLRSMFNAIDANCECAITIFN